MKAEYINPFIESAFTVFTTMINLEPVKENLYLKDDNKTTYDISGIIGIAGDLAGSVVVSLPEDLALKIVSNFLGEEKKALDHEVIDGVGEILNMIAGGAKKIFSDRHKIRFKISVPSVIVGKNHSINRPSDLKFVGINFSVDKKIFSIEVSIKNESNDK
jgi:chemotaxis protein CheX